MQLDKAIKDLKAIVGKRYTKRDRWLLFKALMKGKEPVGVHVGSVSIGYGGYGAVVATDGFRELYIGIPEIGRIWLKQDSTYILDIANEKGTIAK